MLFDLIGTSFGGRDRERREERERRKVAIIGIPTMYLTILTKVEWNDGRTAHTGP